MICEHWHAASWEAAIKAAESYFIRHNRRAAATRTLFRNCLSRFKPALHLLGARTLRRRSDTTNFVIEDAMIDLIQDISVGYRRKTDLLFFAAEARQLQVGLLAWDRNRSPGSGLLYEMLDLDERWTPPPRQPGWPDTGRIKMVALDPWAQVVRGRPGRPRKTPSI